MKPSFYYCGFCHTDFIHRFGNPPTCCPYCGKDALREIIVDLVCPPIPTCAYDVCAFFDGEEETGHYGWGADRISAVNDLISNYGE